MNEGESAATGLERPTDLVAAARSYLLDLEAFGLDLLPRTGNTGPRPSGALSAPAAPATSLDGIATEISACTACGLSGTRSCTVPGQGHAKARMLFVGEAPGTEEDRTGQPFVGEAGQLLTRMIAAMGLQRDDVFITNVLKCRPPDNRDPAPDEVAACWSFLERQIAQIGPQVIVALGAHAARNLLQRQGPLGALRGKVHARGLVQVVVTYHPAYLLRSPDMKRAAWEDLKLALSLLSTGA